MLPSKEYFNTIECPFFLSPTKCTRPYCHFKHPKREARTTGGQSQAPEVAPATEMPVVAPPPPKHIPIAYVPARPSALATKRPRPTYVPAPVLGRQSLDYDPSSVLDSREKTYSRYSYEKGHDSGDEIMENHKSLMDLQGRSDDGSKSGYDDETDDAVAFSPETSDDGTKGPSPPPTSSSKNGDILVLQVPVCNDQADMTELLTDKDSTPVTLDKDKGAHKKPCKYKDRKGSGRSQDRHDTTRDKTDNSSSSPVKSSSSSSSRHKESHNKSEKSSSKDDRRSTSDKSSPKKDSNKKRSDKHEKSSSKNEKHTVKNEKHSVKDRKHSSKNEKHSSKNEKHSIKNEKHTVKIEKQSVKNEKHRDESKKHSEKPSDSFKPAGSKRLSDSKDERDRDKRRCLNEGEKHHKDSTKTKDPRNGDSRHSSRSKTKSDSKHKDSNSEKSDHRSLAQIVKHKIKIVDNDKSSEKRQAEEKSSERKKRKRSTSSDLSVTSPRPKETILISDSDSERHVERRGDSPVDIDDIFGDSDSSDDRASEDNDIYSPTRVGGAENSHEDTLPEHSESTQDLERYTPAQVVPKVRIAHVPNVSSLLTAKTMIGKTVAPTVSTRKVAIGLPPPRSDARGVSAPRPEPQLASDFDSAVASSVRRPGLTNIYNELMKFVSYEEAHRRATEEESQICRVATNPQSYRNRVALCVLRIRKSGGAADSVKKVTITSASIPDYTYGLSLYQCFSKYLLTPEEYSQHGFPMELPGKRGCAYVDRNSYYRKKSTPTEKGDYRKCVNCGDEYAVDEETGFPLSRDNCRHHWGKPYGTRQGKVYSCCKSEVGSEACHTAAYHVSETDDEDCLRGYVKALPYPEGADPDQAGIYALDCEMCYTTKGRDLVRASFLAVDDTTVHDFLVKPAHPILDYCTRFSGITAEKLAPVTTTLRDVQKFMLRTISEKTILVGHSLENDLRALRLIHYNVVDTSLMFPHKEGLPFKCALRTLCSRHLGAAIQTGEDGHDSLEDARGALRLVLHQVRQDAKLRKPRVVTHLPSKRL